MGSFDTPLLLPPSPLFPCPCHSFLLARPSECIPILLVLHVLELRLVNMVFLGNQGPTSQYIQSLPRQHSPVQLLIQDSMPILRQSARLTIGVGMQPSQF